MRSASPCLALMMLAGCSVGPNYKRPPVSVPDQYYHAPVDQPAGATSLGDEKWWALFEDQELQNLIRTGLKSSYDVQIAASRILQAQAQVGITRADQFPTVSAGPGFSSQRLPGFTFSYFQLEALFSWNPDFWGRYRRATEAARAQLLAAQWNRQEVISTLVANLATAYFQMRELDSELDISRNTLASRRESLALTETLANGGAAAMVDVRQAEQLVETAAETIPDTERQIGLQEDLISTLAGDNPHAIPRGLPLTEQPAPPVVPAGLPSRLLERRPDIRAAEEQLAAATANIGVARAAFFPSLSLTGGGGIASSNLASLFTGPGAVWNFSAPLTQPIFEAGRLRSNLRLTEAQQQEALLTYRQTIQTAFRQVSDALIAYQKYHDFREHQERLTAAAQDAARLSDLRYRGGATSYLEVLTSQTNWFSAQLNLARARLNERLSLVQLYNALGGGWE
ncbi:MAG TPA: efflux transporter outer membrane subunit [Bryobacteraceae bacterium]|nr:efflux transporter outer membrane subunit [Bryobacteraceae bacterium]